MKTRKILLAALTCVAAIAAAPGVHAQASGIKREMLQRSDLSAPGHEAMVARIEVAPGVMAGRHTHFGEEISYVLEGEGELLIDGEAPRKLKAGDSFIVPAGKVHDARNTGSGPFRLVGVFVVEKGKPLATPAK